MKRLTVLSIGVAAALALGACSDAAGGGSTSATSVGAPTPEATSSGGDGRGGRFGALPGVSGLVADVTGTTAQVQTPNSQTAVTWTGTTRFSQQRAATAAAVKVGDCVIAVAAAARPATGGQGGASTTPSGQPTSLNATTVEVLSAGSTGCNAAGPGRGGAGRSGPGGTPTSRPSGIPMPRASFTNRARNGARLAANGTVTAVRSSSFTIRSTRGFTSPRPTNVTVTWTSSTNFTTLASASASAVKVGVCLSASGRADDTGAVTATAITLSSPINGSCVGVGAFGRRPGGSATTGATLNG